MVLAFGTTGVRLRLHNTSIEVGGELPESAVEGGWVAGEGGAAYDAWPPRNSSIFNESIPKSITLLDATTVLFKFSGNYVPENVTFPLRMWMRILGDVLEQVGTSSCVRPTSLAVELVVLESPPTASKTTAATAATTAAAVGAAVSVVTLNPATAAQIARLSSLQEISACVFENSGDTPVGFSGGSFTSLKIGESRGKYLRGGIIGNALVVLGGTAVLAIFLLVWLATTKSAAERENNTINAASSNISDLGSRHASSDWMQDFSAALEMGRLPSLYLPVYMVCAPATVGFGVALLSVTPVTTENVVLGSLTVSAFVVYATCVSRNLVRCFRLKLGHVTPVPRLNWLVFLCRPTDRWESSCAEDESWRRRNRLYFDAYNRWWFGLVDLWTSLAVGIINGISVSSREVCAAQIAMIMILFLTVLVIGLWFDPCTTRSLRYYLHTSNFLGFLSGCLLVASVRMDSAELLEISNWLMAILSAASVLKMIVDVAYVLYRYVRGMGTAGQKMKSIAGDPSPEVDLESELLVLPVQAHSGQEPAPVLAMTEATSGMSNGEGGCIQGSLMHLELEGVADKEERPADDESFHFDDDL